MLCQKSYRKFRKAFILSSLMFGASLLPGFPAGYRLVEGYTVLDELNFPGVTATGYFAATAGLERDIALDPVRNIVYMARGLANVSTNSTDQDGRTQGMAGPAAVVLGPYNGSNYKDTGLMINSPGSVPVSFHQSLAYDPVLDKVFVFGGTNIFGEGTTTVEPFVYSALGGSLGGAPVGGNPNAVAPVFIREFQVKNDLNLGGSPRGFACRTVVNQDGSKTTTVYLAMGNHAQAWRNDNSDVLSGTYPWRRIWATLPPPNQDLVTLRTSGSGSPVNGIAVDSEGNCYFNLYGTVPARIWCVRAGVEQVVAHPNALDFNDRYFGGSNSGRDVVVLPVIIRGSLEPVTVNGVSSFSKPQGITAFDLNSQHGLFVSFLPNSSTRTVARLLLDENPISDGISYLAVPATIMDAFGSGAAPGNQDSALQTMRGRDKNGLTQPVGGTKSLLYTEVNTYTNPTHIYLTTFLMDTARGQTNAVGTLAKIALPTTEVAAPVILSVDPAVGSTKGGTEVIITGTNFTSTSWVYFDGYEALDVVVESASRLRVTTPPHPSGFADVSVETPGAAPATLPGAFGFRTDPAPVRMYVSPISDDSAFVSWDTESGRTYLLQSSSTLRPGSWTTRTTVVADGTSSYFIDSGLTGAAIFYRVIVQQ